MVKYRLTRHCKNNTIAKSNSGVVAKKFGLKKRKPKNKPNKPNNKLKKELHIYDRELIPQVERNLICYKQCWKCNLCNEMFKCTIIIDHIRPLFLGGCNNLNNYQGLCDICDKIKTGIIDQELKKSFHSGDITETNLTTNYIINKQICYYKRKNYNSFIN